MTKENIDKLEQQIIEDFGQLPYDIAILISYLDTQKPFAVEFVYPDSKTGNSKKREGVITADISGEIHRRGGTFASTISEKKEKAVQFDNRLERTVKKDGTVSWNLKVFTENDQFPKQFNILKISDLHIMLGIESSSMEDLINSFLNDLFEDKCSDVILVRDKLSAKHIADYLVTTSDTPTTVDELDNRLFVKLTRSGESRVAIIESSFEEFENS